MAELDARTVAGAGEEVRATKCHIYISVWTRWSHGQLTGALKTSMAADMEQRLLFFFYYLKQSSSLCH